MDAQKEHRVRADASFDGGNLDCGNGLLLLIRQNLDRLEAGELLEIISSESSVEEDLPAWCRLTSNELVSWTKDGSRRSFIICRGTYPGRKPEFESGSAGADSSASTQAASAFTQAASGDPMISVSSGSAEPADEKAALAQIAALSVMGIGSWPRPKWLLPHMHRHLEAKLSDTEFDEIANDAVRLCVQAQIEAGVDLITDGEQRRDNYASFIGLYLDGCQLIPLSDLLALVNDPKKFEEELKSLDVPADKVRHPAVLGRLARKKQVGLSELKFLKSISSRPAKIALPGPYLLSRLMWMDCITNKVYLTREELAAEIVGIIRAEIKELLEGGAALIQLDEPVLSEVVFGHKEAGGKEVRSKDSGLEEGGGASVKSGQNKRSFMCGALSEALSVEDELDFARTLINEVVSGFPTERLAMHICRGNWTADESAALSGDYEQLIDLFNSIKVGTLFLEYCTERAGDLSLLSQLRPELRVGLGSVNPKTERVETVESIVAKAEVAASYLAPGGKKRLLLNPDCGFATFADNPVNSSEIAKAKLQALVHAARKLKS